MTTTSIETRPQLAPSIRALLEALRGRIRRYVWLEGLASGVAWLGVAFWGSLMIDWFFEPSPAVRATMLLGVLLVFGGVLLSLIGRRAFVRLSDGNMATLLERRFKEFNDSLLTAVLLTGRKVDPAECNQQMLARACRQAGERVVGVKLQEVFDPVPLRRSITAAVLLVATIVAFGLLAPEALGTWARRSLLLSAELWPRKTRLLVDGFEGGARKVARGADFELIAKADTRWPVVPQVVQVRYRTEGGARDRRTMNRLGAARGADDHFQEYSYTFQAVLAPITFDVVGGDARVDDLRIEVVESPTVVEMTLECEFSPYMHRAPRTLLVSGVTQIPLGTQVTVVSTTNKDLVKVQVDSVLEETSLPRKVLDSSELAADPRRFRYTIASLDRDTTLLFTLFDTDGISSREPVRLALATIADAPPQLAVRLSGIGSAVTPRARLPVVGQISDDYGIDKVWFEHTIDQTKPGTHAVAAPPSHPSNLELENAGLEVRDLGLTPGQKLLVCLKASDLYDLGEAPNEGTSERWLLDVVTPEQLRAILVARELVLRQRFEVIIREVTETRDLLLGIDFDSLDPDNEAGEETDEKTDDKEVDQQKIDDGSEPGDEPGDERPEKLPPERRAVLRTLRVERALQNSRKNAHETQGVADAFTDIRLQLINNRIDIEELNIRLKQGIADPLNQIAQQMFPELARRIERLQARLNDKKLSPRHRDLAREQAGAILLAMQRVLDRMVELEDFNEALALLRTIIGLQEKLSEQTKQRRKQKIRLLLED